MRTHCTLLLAGAAVLGLAHGAEAALAVKDPRCEYARNPMGVETLRPRLSWKLASDQRAQRQTAYEILVASTPEKLAAGQADLWNTGKVASASSIQVPYGGAPLSSRRRCYWKVRVWDRDGAPTPFSEPASWEMGLLSERDWEAGWIGYSGGWNGRALYFRRNFALSRPVRQARIYVAGLGYSEVRVNGRRVGDSVLDPGWTDYSKRVLYSTYDAGTLLRPGRNTIAVVAGNGWYGMPKLLLQMEAVYRDGSLEKFVTLGAHGPQSWKVSGGPVLANSIYDGETYDARLEKPGWDSPGSPDNLPVDREEAWTTAVPVEPPGGRLVSQQLEPIRIVSVLEPASVTEPRPGVFVFDTGQNLAGWAELRVRGARGSRVTLRFAENLRSDGTVNQENLRKAAATDVYILKGGDEEVWEPRFTYHGFRYVQLEGFPGRAGPDNLKIKVVRSAVEPNGVFESSHELLNRIQKMIWWTEASNLHSVPTDCPQRDERQGWMNDLTVRLEEAMYNFQLPRFVSKFLADVRDTQGPDGAITDTVPFRWGFRPADPVSASYLLLGWLPYLHYGDTRLMEEHFEGFQAWTDYLAGRSKNGIVEYGNYGDWSPPKAFSVSGSHLGTGAVSSETPIRLMSTGYLYYCSRLLSDMAQVLGKQRERARYEQLARETRAAIDREFWNEAAGGYASNNQASNSFALYLGLARPERIPRVVENLVADVRKHGGHLTTGNLCTKYLLETLADNGRADVAFEIATRKTYPSWGFMLENGATTLWERWEHLTGGQMNSHNHPMMGSVSSWFFKYLGGIRPDPRGPGFKRFVIRPQTVRGLDWVRSSYNSPFGTIRSDWRRVAGGITYHIGVPAGSSATIYIPAPAGARVTEGGKDLAGALGIKLPRSEGETVVLEAASGDYEFTARDH